LTDGKNTEIEINFCVPNRPVLAKQNKKMVESTLSKEKLWTRGQQGYRDRKGVLGRKRLTTHSENLMNN